MVWALAERATKGRPAPKEVQHLRRLKKAMKDSSVTGVSNTDRQLVRDCTQNDVTEEQAYHRLRALWDSA